MPINPYVNQYNRQLDGAGRPSCFGCALRGTHPAEA